jgi:hypothetical protein
VTEVTHTHSTRDKAAVGSTSGMSVGSMIEYTSGVSISNSATSRMQLMHVCMRRA